MKTLALSSLVLVGFGILSLACSPGNAVPSETKEAVDGNSAMSRLGVKQAPTYADLAAVTSVKKPTLPWTDTYWPLNEKSLARRWTKSEEKLGLASYFQSQSRASRERRIDPTLSPADKYDILFRWRHGKVLDDSRNESLMKEWSDLESSLDLSAEFSTTKGRIKDAYKKLRSNDLKEFRSLFPMSSNGWNDFLYYSSSDKFAVFDLEGSGEDWSWMGSCHGWAPAALMEETPKHSVLAKIDDQEVLVTEGDMRGLLTKAWADHSPSDSQFFLGRRCGENMENVQGEIPHGAAGKGYYGQIVRGESKQDFYVRAEIYLAYLPNTQRVYPVNYSDTDATQGYLIETSRDGKRSYVLAQDLETVRRYVQGDQDASVEALSSVKMYGCWDVNPASFHVALLEKLGKDGVGLVMDRTRTGQVWNQPIFAADFEVSALKEIWDAPLSNKRALGTKYLASVKAVVKWVGEPSQPRMSYSQDFDARHVQESTYTYVLEFDRNKKLIGGEWGSLEKTDPAQVTPDFIYGFAKDSKPKDDLTSGFDYTGIIQALHACSVTNDTDGVYEIGSSKLPYKTCVLNKSGR